MFGQRLLELPGGGSVHDPGEQTRVVLAQEGNVDALGELYDQHHESVFRYVLARVGDQHLAEDLTGDVFMKMLAGLNGYRPKQVPFRAWLYRIARNRVTDHYRREGLRTHTALDEADGPSPDDDLESSVETSLTVERVQHAVADLDDTQREVVVLRFLIGLSLREVAAALEKSVGAVKSLQHRGLTALRSQLAHERS